MTQEHAGYIEVEHPAEIADLVETLTWPGAASLMLERAGFAALPVVVVNIVRGECITLDVTAIGEVVPALRRGTGLRLLGQGADGMFCTPVLAVRAWEDIEDRVHCRCEYPHSVQHYQRRDNYRASLRLGMHVGVLLRDPDKPTTFQGDLKNLSMNGCLVELHPSATEALGRDELELELCFPSGERFVVRAAPRYYRTDSERSVLAVGFRFASTSQEQDRQLWYYVRETEREAARSACAETSSLQSSALFQPSVAEPAIGLRHALPYATPMARRLARVAAFLDNQLLDLRDGRSVNPVALSRAADRLLNMLDEDREALLFALVCLPHDPQLVQHGLAVAVRLVDIGRAFNMRRELLKALAACGMMHDLGKVLLPAEVLESAARSDEQEREYRQHTALLLPRLDTCQWLSGAVREAVIEGANERLDGSGYPRQLCGDQLHELARLTAVVVEVDRMGRPTVAGEALSIDVIQRQLASNSRQFDTRWVRRYFAHFGRLPVGTLVRYASGELAWVLRLDASGEPAQIHLTDSVATPHAAALGKVVTGAGLALLGVPEPLAPPLGRGVLYY